MKPAEEISLLEGLGLTDCVQGARDEAPDIGVAGIRAVDSRWQGRVWAGANRKQEDSRVSASNFAEVR